LCQSSVLGSGKWVKMSFSESGLYKITWNKLREFGFDPSDIDPKNIAIYGQTGGMLPQSLSENRYIDLQENPITVVGESDGVFGENDYILFYVDEINQVDYDANSDQFNRTKNLYTDEIFYFLTTKNEPGLRLEAKPDLGSSGNLVKSARHLVYHETDETNILSSGREWFGEQLNAINSISFQHQTPSLSPNSTVKVFAEFLSQAYVSTSLDIQINNNALGTLNFEAIPNSQYAVKGNLQNNTFSISSTQIDDSQINVQFTYNRNGANSSVAYLNKYWVDLPIEPVFTNNPLFLRYPAQNSGISTFSINSNASAHQVWDVTDPTNIKEQQHSVIDNNIIFSTFSNTYTEFIVFNSDNLPEPDLYEDVQNQDLKSSVAVDFLIITHESLHSEAQRLADFRNSHDQLSVQVTTVNQIYNEFSAGRQDVSAIRNFIKYKYDQGTLKYVLFFGKGSYDYKDRIEENTNLVPIYESRNSIHPLLTFASDDFYGFLENHEGEWEESTAGDHSLDIGVGRIPAKDLAQAKKAVDKIILYQTSPSTLGDWRSKVLFVADDGDRNIHQRDADQLATLVDTSFQQFQIRKLYLDAFKQERLPSGETSKDAEKALIDAVNEGRLIINFTGHGAEFGWMQERILTFELMEEWRNTYKLPFLITATCEFGRNDDPLTESGAERLIFKNVGGTIGLLTTTRPVFSSTNYRLNQALYETMLNKQGDEYQRLGDVIKYTKNNSLEGSLNRNFILLGDPSMRLSYPQNEISITAINGKTPSKKDTIKALQPVTIEGQISAGGQLNSSFQGTIGFTLFDKSQEKTTRGSENPPFQFQERDIVLFKGTASVSSGKFKLDFIVPKNINYAFGEGKMLVYAIENNENADALGSNLNFTLGGTFENHLVDNTPPEIRIFLNDTLQAVSGIYDQNVKTIIKLSDESGINISESVLGQSLTLNLNDSLSFNLNDRYSAQLDNYKKGIAELDLEDLSTGKYTLTVSARDVHGNSSSKTVEFEVRTKSSFITEIKSYPNPFIDETFFSVRHNLLGENLNLEIEILNSRGQPVNNLLTEILSAEETIQLKWDGKNHHKQSLEAGIYFYTLRLASNTTGKSDFVRGKMIISN
jgi:hypothetical protein